MNIELLESIFNSWWSGLQLNEIKLSLLISIAIWCVFTIVWVITNIVTAHKSYHTTAATVATIATGFAAVSAEAAVVAARAAAVTAEVAAVTTRAEAFTPKAAVIAARVVAAVIMFVQTCFALLQQVIRNIKSHSKLAKNYSAFLLQTPIPFHTITKV